MNFGEALKAIKEGKKVSRESWTDKTRHLYLSENVFPFKLNKNKDVKTDKSICVKTGTSSVARWFPMQTDILAEDWKIVE